MDGLGLGLRGWQVGFRVTVGVSGLGFMFRVDGFGIRAYSI